MGWVTESHQTLAEFVLYVALGIQFVCCNNKWYLSKTIKYLHVKFYIDRTFHGALYQVTLPKWYARMVEYIGIHKLQKSVYLEFFILVLRSKDFFSLNIIMRINEIVCFDLRILISCQHTILDIWLSHRYCKLKKDRYLKIENWRIVKHILSKACLRGVSRLHSSFFSLIIRSRLRRCCSEQYTSTLA